MAFNFGMTVDLCGIYIYAHADFDYLDLDARSQWVSRGKTIQYCHISTTKQAINITLPATVDRFFT